MIYITKALINDIQIIKGMAEIVFRHTYESILSSEQIKYMMEWMYSVESIERQFSEKHIFFIAYKEDIPCGYMSIQNENNSNLYYIHKLYVMPEHQGKRVGESLFRKALEYVNENRKENNAHIELNVNRNNKAILFYKRMGMKVAGERDFHIGNGYYMNGYMSIDII